MSAQQIERELAEYLASSDYEVRFQHARDYNWFRTFVLFRGDIIGYHTCCRSYTRQARWAKRVVRKHATALGILGPLHRVSAPAEDRVST